MTHFLLNHHREDEREKIWAKECQGRTFSRSYKDNEVDHEEEKKLYVRRTKESLPFGMNIRKAAYKATFGKTTSVL